MWTRYSIPALRASLASRSAALTCIASKVSVPRSTSRRTASTTPNAPATALASDDRWVNIRCNGPEPRIIAAGRVRVPRCNTNGKSFVVQMTDDPSPKKPSPAKHGHSLRHASCSL